MKPANGVVALLSALALVIVCGCGSQNNHSIEARGETHFQRALDYQDQAEPELAKKEYRLAIKENPDDSRAYVNLAMIHIKEGDLVTANGYLVKAVNINPSDFRAFNALGGVEMRREHRDKAIYYYSRALELAPEYAEAHYNIAGAYRRIGHKEKAGEHYRAYIDFASPDDTEGLAEAKDFVGDTGEQE